MPHFKPTPQQQAIFDWITEGQGSATISAVAGSGKTSTIVEGASLLPLDAKAIFLAFNKSIASELQDKLPLAVPASTFHSLCLRSLPRPRVFGGKLRVTAKEARRAYRLTDDDFEATLKLVGLAKAENVNPQASNVSFQDLIARHDLTVEATNQVVQFATALINDTWNNQSTVDFDDMLWFVAQGRGQLPIFDWIMVDEVQDTNATQRAVLKRMVAPHTRVVGVGDPYQAIYGFRGADSNAFQQFALDFNCAPLDLSVSFRCPQAVVQAAQAIVPHIQAHESAPMGQVKAIHQWSPQDLDQKGAVVCRNTAPIMKLAYRAIASRVPVRVLGRDIGANLIALIRKTKATSIKDLALQLDRQLATEVPALAAADRNVAAELLTDKIESIFAAIEGVGATATIDELINSINSLFTDDNHRLTLCTVHKAKGLEWPTVYILNAFLMPSKWAIQPWQQDQERNIQYVAITRAKANLFYIDQR